MSSRRKKDRISLEVKKEDPDKAPGRAAYMSKKKRSHEDNVEMDDDSCKVLRYSRVESFTSEKASKSYSRVGRTTSTSSVPVSDVNNGTGISNFRIRVTKTYGSPKKNVSPKTDEGQPAAAVMSTRSSSLNLSSMENSAGDFQDDSLKEESADSEIGDVPQHLNNVVTASQHNEPVPIHHNNHCLSAETSKLMPVSEENYNSNYSTSRASKSINTIPDITESTSQLPNSENQTAELVLTRADPNDLVTASSHIPVTFSFSTIAPVLQPMYGAGVPSMMQHQLVTSAIASVATPITTVPVLPEIVGSLTLGTLTANQFENSGTPLPISTSSENLIRQVSPNSGFQTVERNSLQTNTFDLNINGEKEEIKIDSEEHKIVCDSSASDCVPEFDCETAPVPVPLKVNHSSASTKACKGVSSASEFIQIDNWGTYLLQRLELLYEQEQECDLTLKFYGGEILKVHRTVVVACTSLLSGADVPHCQGEYTFPPDLTYSHVEPIVRFVYSGRLDLRGLHKEIGSIYSAARKLQVPLLTRLMERRFPHLTAPTTHRRRLPIWKRNPKLLHHSRENAKKKFSKVIEAGKKSYSTIHKTLNSRSLTISKFSNKLSKSGNIAVMMDSTTETNDMDEEEEDDGQRQDKSVYLVLPKGKNIMKANAILRSKFTAEKARPTRFELEEDSEHSHVRIATWSSSKSSTVPPPFLPSTSTRVLGMSSASPVSSMAAISPFDAILASSNPIPPVGKQKNSNAVKKKVDKAKQNNPVSGKSQDQPGNVESIAIEISDPASTCEDEVKEETDDIICLDKDDKDSIQVSDNLSDLQNQHGEIKLSSDKNVETCETDKPKSEDEDDDDNGDEKPYVCNYVQSSQENEEEDFQECSDSPMATNSEIPSKSILKTKDQAIPSVKVKKHVSFPLTENDEVISEVATYSHEKEPAQSIFEVKKNIGPLKLASDMSTPVKVTLSLKKKVLRNVSLGDSEGSELSNMEKKKLSKKDGNASLQGTSQDELGKGDLSSHAKIISEVLKKYPNLVKDKKNVRLKILKKGSDKNSGGKVKSKVQYLVLSEGESTGKSASKSTKSSKSGAKTDSMASSRTVNNTQNFQCPQCVGVFQSYFAFKKHVTSDHKEQSSTILANVENVPYACYTCFSNEPLEFSDYFSYQQHMQDVHSNTETRVCNICGFKPKRKLELAYHQYSEHNKAPRNYSFPKCDLCDFVAINEAALLKHRSQHANADSYTCSVCGVTFCSFGALQGHMQTKLCQNKPTTSYKCPHCPLTFARSYNLKAHCKSSHRSVQASIQVVPVSLSNLGDNKLQETLIVESEETKSEETTSYIAEEQGEPISEGITGSTISTQSSSEAEALSTVASSLAASLGLPEETVNQYMYTQGCAVEGDKAIEGTGSVSVQIVDAVASASGYQDEQQQMCTNTTFATQAPVANTTSVGALYPVSVVSNQLVSNHMVPGQILSSQILQSGCISTGGGSVLGSVPHSWTYVTYQVPSQGEDHLPTVIAEAGSINTTTINTTPINNVPITSHQDVTSHQDITSLQDVTSELASHHQANMEVSETDKSGSSCEPLNSLVVVANTATQVDNMNHSSIYL